jgi:hypothetical protein
MGNERREQQVTKGHAKVSRQRKAYARCPQTVARPMGCELAMSRVVPVGDRGPELEFRRGFLPKPDKQGL